MEFFLYDEGQAFLKNLILILEHICFFEMHAFFFFLVISNGYPPGIKGNIKNTLEK